MVRVVKDAATEILAESKRQVPRRDSILIRTATKRVAVEGNRVAIEISYNTPYAAIQHEDLSFSHPHGKAKYLEDPIKAHTPKLKAALEAAYREAIR